MACREHPHGSVLGCAACAIYDSWKPRENIRAPKPHGVSQQTPGRGYDEEDAAGNEEGA